MRPLILITNDDGIDSPGLHATAEAIADLGELLIVAPASQQTGAGRSYPLITDKAIYETAIPVHGIAHQAYKTYASPAQVVAIAFVELASRPISLCISGINYGENVGSGITVSGTVGAAMEASSFGVPSLAMSLQLPVEHHLSHSKTVDFSTAAYFTRYFAERVLEKGLPAPTALLKIDIPQQATTTTPWEWACVSTNRYYTPTPSGRTRLDEQKTLGYAINYQPDTENPNSDIYVLMVKQHVAVAPITLDLTAPITPIEFQQHFSS